MLLGFDIGNTNIVVGCFIGDELAYEFRLKTDSNRSSDEYAALILQLLRERFGEGFKIARCVISSVVPHLTPTFTAIVGSRFNLTPLLVGPGIKTGIQIKVPDPASVGADRVVNSLAAKVLFGSPALVIDFGTATTFDYVSTEGAYEGGIIAPGIGVSVESLVRNTAKLPRIELSWPDKVIGKTTVDAMRSGAVIGYVAMVDGLIERIFNEVGIIPHVISTGGTASLVSPYCARIQKNVPDLTLQGILLISKLNEE